MSNSAEKQRGYPDGVGPSLARSERGVRDYHMKIDYGI
jgi:hypothetical protein